MANITARKNYIVAGNAVELIARATTKALTKLGHGTVPSSVESQNIADAAAASIQSKMTQLSK